MNISLSKLSDPGVRQMAEDIQRTYNDNELNLGGFTLFSIYESTAVTNKELRHNLGFVPTDIIITKMMGGEIIFNYDTATESRIYYTTSAATDTRALIGRI